MLGYIRMLRGIDSHCNAKIMLEILEDLLEIFLRKMQKGFVDVLLKKLGAANLSGRNLQSFKNTGLRSAGYIDLWPKQLKESLSERVLVRLFRIMLVTRLAIMDLSYIQVVNVGKINTYYINIMRVEEANNYED